jgi:hypothetical protein
MIAMLLLAGCAQITPPSQLSQLEMSKNAGSVLLVVQVANAFKPEHQATSLDVTIKPSDYRPRIVPAGEPDPAAAFQHTLNLVKLDEKSSTFVLLMPLAPGNYVLQNMNGSSVRFPIMGNFQVPVGGAITVRAGRLVYLGRVEAVIRERKSDQEPRAGSLLPLIDQRVAGFSTGTFDLVVKDASAEDLASLETQLGKVTLDQVDIALVTAQK